MNLAQPSIMMIVVMFAVSAFCVCYFCGLSVLGVRECHKQGVSVRRQEDLMDAPVNPDPDLQGLYFYAIVPALNEERVIGGTIRSFLDTQPNATLIVVDDASEDGTGQIIDSFTDTGRVICHTRVKPNAQLGKGRALNAGLRVVREHAARRGLAPSAVVVCVLDADGRMSPNALEAVAVPFATRPSVGGGQLAVRIRNALTPPEFAGLPVHRRVINWLHHMLLVAQDQIFWTTVALSELGRNFFGSAAMGGNGQFARLACLNEIGENPWSDSLTEDLDLGLSICKLGWDSVGVAGGYVSQQGLTSLRRMVRQWTRWTQGTMVAAQRVPELIRSRHMSNTTLLEVLGVLFTPWAAMCWSYGEQFLLIQYATGHSGWHFSQYPLGYQIVLFIEAYLVTFGPCLFWTIVYNLRAKSIPLWKAAIVSHLLFPWSWLALAMTTRAIVRIVLRRGSWAKTAREVEESTDADSPVLPLQVGEAPSRHNAPQQPEARPEKAALAAPSATDAAAPPETLAARSATDAADADAQRSGLHPPSTSQRRDHRVAPAGGDRHRTDVAPASRREHAGSRPRAAAHPLLQRRTYRATHRRGAEGARGSSRSRRERGPARQS